MRNAVLHKMSSKLRLGLRLCTRQFWCKLIVAAVALLGSALSALATTTYTETDDNGIKWTYTINNGEAGVGSGAYLDNVIPRNMTNDVIVPSELGGCPVTKINSYAFYKCQGLHSITLPPCLKIIGVNSFYDCRLEEGLVIPEGVTHIESGAFYGANVNQIHIPDTVTKIGQSAFSGAKLDSAFIPSSVVEIANYAFSVDCPISVDKDNPNYSSDENGSLYNKDKTTIFNCGPKNITSVNIRSTVTAIGPGCFSCCRWLESILIPATVTYIGESAFSQCYSLKTAIIESTGAIICSDAFYSCTALENLVISGMETIVDGYAFRNCTALENLTISGTGTIVYGYAFRDCTALETVTVGPGVKEIASFSFWDCNKLRAVNVDASNPCLYSIDGVLYDKRIKKLILCPKAKTSLALPNDLESIDAWACAYNSNITTLTIPSTVTNVFEYAFYGNSNLKTLTIQPGVAANGRRSLDESAFQGCGLLTSLTLGEGITHIGKRTFADCTSLTSVHIPSSVAYIGDYAFSGCTKLAKVSFGQGTRTISGTAFSDCSAFTTVTVDPNARRISEGTFSGGSTITRVNIGSLVEDIDPAAFKACSSLAEIVVDENNPDFRTVNGVLYNKNLTTLVYWPPAKQPLSIPDTVTAIGPSALVGCTWLETIALPEAIVSIGANAFAGCAGLCSIVFGDNLTTIEQDAFRGCNELQDVQFPDSIITIGPNAFANCNALQNVLVVPGDVARVKKLLSQSGKDCSTLTFVELWDSSLSISPDRLPEGAIDVGYSSVLTAEGGVGPYSWRVIPHTVEGAYSENRVDNSFSCSGEAKGWKYDDKCWAYSLPFAFPFYGELRTTAYVNSNGTLTFDGTFNGHSESLSELKNHAMIAVMWDDLKTNANSGDIYVTATGDEVTFRWKGAYYSGGAEVNFAVTLSASGRIRLTYGSGNRSGGLVGVSAGDGSRYLVCSCSQNGSLGGAQDVVLDMDQVTLPDGIMLSEDGMLSGMPIEAGNTLVDLMVTDAMGRKNHKEFLLVVRETLPDGSYVDVVDGIEWHYLISGGRAIVVADGSESSVPSSTTGALTLPLKLGACPVIGIGEWAFAYCDGLTSITIPASVTSIVRTAFDGCSGLMSFDVDSANVKYSSPNGLLCSKDGKIVIAGVNRDVVIPAGVTSIGEGSFCGCGGLTELTIPSSVKSIGENAFADCENLTKIHVDEGATGEIKQLLEGSGFNTANVQFVEPPLPEIAGDEDAVVTGNAQIGYVIRPSAGKETVEVTIPVGIDPEKVTIEVTTAVKTVRTGGAKLVVKSGGHDITEYLDLPNAGFIDLANVAVKESVVKEALTGEGAVVSLDASSPAITTAATKPGLTYSFREGRTLEAIAAKAEPDDTYDGDGQPWTPKISVSGGDSAFYSLGVGIGK